MAGSITATSEAIAGLRVPDDLTLVIDLPASTAP